jgi:thiol-disulfide isomerase/thioredoxin
MKMIVRLTVSGMALAIAHVGAVAQEAGIAVGSPAPAAVVESLDGTLVDLGRYIGKEPLLIEFWATWCPSCEKLEPALVEAHRKYGTRVRFIGVAVSVNQSPERVRRYVEKHRLTHEILFDRKGDAVTKYDVPATSYIVVIDRAGNIVL